MKKLIFIISLSFIFLSNIKSQNCDIIVISQNTNVSLDNNGEAEVTPDIFVIGDISQCNYEIALSSNNGDGTFTIVIPYASSITLTCEFVGTYVVSVRDVDSGNIGWADVNIQDMIGACSIYFGPDTYSLVYSPRNTSGPFNTDVTLNGNLVNEVYDWLDTIPQSDLVDGENVLDFPATSAPSLSGISTLDLVEMHKMFVFDDVEYPLRAVLSDADDSGYLNVEDLVLWRNFILGIQNTDVADNHLYISKTYEFPSDFDPFDFTDLNFREYKFDKDAVTQEDLEFFVYSYGDINWLTDSLTNDEVVIRSNNKLELSNREVNQGEIIQVPVKLTIDDFEMYGLQLGLAFDGLELINIDHNYSGAVLLDNHLSSQDYRISFMDTNGASEFNAVIELQVLENGELRDMISLNTDFEQLAVGYDQYANIELEFLSTSSTIEVEEFFTSMNGTELQIAIPVNHQEIIAIYDVQGKVLHKITPQSELVSVDMSGLTDGMYFVSTVINNKPQTQKIIFINQ